MQKPFGWGAFGAECVERVLVLETAAVETAEAKKKIPASAIPLSIGGVSRDVVSGWRRSVEMTEPPSRDEGPVQRAHHGKPREFRAFWGSRGFSSRTRAVARITIQAMDAGA
jgi:hypothetical protein